MKAVLKRIYSPDLPAGQNELPQDTRNCWVVVCAEIGADDSDGADIFTFYVTTPAFLKGEGPKPATIVLDEFTWQAVEDRIADICNATEGRDWETIAKQISQVSEWEFENDKK